jgi:hypothetical protein
VTVAAAAAILAFGAGLVEGLVRGGGVVCVPEAAIAGFVWGTIAAGVVALGHGVARLLPAGLRAGGWPLAIAAAAVVFVAVEFAVARALAARFRDPTLVAVATAVAGVMIAWSLRRGGRADRGAGRDGGVAGRGSTADALAGRRRVCDRARRGGGVGRVCDAGAGGAAAQRGGGAGDHAG